MKSLPRRQWATSPAAALILAVLGTSSTACAPRDPGPTVAADANALRPLVPEPLYSQGNEESIIRDFFRDRTNGFFLDVGAAWPIANSNTYYLESHLGWSGIAVDALPEYGPSWEESRPRSRFYSYLVTDRAGTVETFYRSELTGVSSYRREGAQGPSGKTAYEETEVPSITLNHLLEASGVSRVDFVSMDIEGAELMALAGFDIDRFRPELVCIEAKAVNRTGIFEYFEAHGYERIERYLEYDQTNYYFTPKAAAVSVHDPYREAPGPLARGLLAVLTRGALALSASHVLPGLLLVGVLGLGANPLERWVFAAVLGGAISGAIYWVSLVSGAPSLYWVLLGTIDLAAIYRFRRDRALFRPMGLPRATPALGLLLLFSALGAAYLLSTGRFYRVDSHGSFLLDPAFTEDALFHAAIVEGLQSSFPPELLSISGERVYPYHVGYHLQVAAWQRFFGLDRYDGICRVGVVWWLLLLILSAYSFGLRFSRSPGMALAATVLLFGGGLGFVFHQASAVSWWSLVFMDAAIVSILLIDPLLPALSLFFVALACLDDYLERSHRGALAASSLCLVALFAVKELLAAQLLSAIVLGSVLARGRAAVPARWAALVLCLASTPALLAWRFAFRESAGAFGLRPLEIVRYFTDTVGHRAWSDAVAAVGGGSWDARSLGLAALVTVLWFVGFLGIRLLAGPGVIRDAVSRAGSTRSALSLFVLIGFPLTLLVHITRGEPVGIAPEALNQAFRFATFSGVAAWLWTAEALASVARRSWKVGALALSAAALLAFPSTLQHFVHKISLAVEAISVPEVEVAAASASRAFSRPDEVFVEPSRRARPSLSASLAGRPVVYDSFASRDRTRPRLDTEFRRHAVAQFWSSPDSGYGSWFLSHFNVRWILNPRDVLSAQAGGRWASPVFANDGAAIYRVGDLPNVRLRIPERLPLGGRGAGFFGQGWGPPESTPRIRRLMPGTAVLYVPTNDAQSLYLELSLGTPHVGGRLRLGGEWVELEPDTDQLQLVVPASEAERGLSRLELAWQGAEPLVVTGIRLREEFT